MKKRLLLFSVLFGANYYAQTPITIDAIDLPVVGTKMINVNELNTLGIDVGLPGANQTYDFSSFTNTSEDTISYVLPSQTIFSGSFPNANITTMIINAIDTSYTFFNSSATQLNVQGRYLTIPFLGAGIAIASDPLIQLNLPATYQSTFTDLSALSTSAVAFQQGLPAGTIPVVDTAYIDSVRAQISINRTSLIDGWGTVITPFGTYTVLRQLVTDITTYTPEMYVVTESSGFVFPLGYISIPGTEFSDTVNTFYYLSNSNPFQPMVLAEISQNNAGLITSAKYAKTIYSLSASEIMSDENIKLFPNPSADILTIESNNSIKGVKLVGIDGKELINEKLNSNFYKMDLTAYNSGVYTVIVECENGLEIKKINKL